MHIFFAVPMHARHLSVLSRTPSSLHIRWSSPVRKAGIHEYKLQVTAGEKTTQCIDINFHKDSSQCTGTKVREDLSVGSMCCVISQSIIYIIIIFFLIRFRVFVNQFVNPFLMMAPYFPIM